MAEICQSPRWVGNARRMTSKNSGYNLQYIIDIYYDVQLP